MKKQAVKDSSKMLPEDLKLRMPMQKLFYTPTRHAQNSANNVMMPCMSNFGIRSSDVERTSFIL